MIRRDRILITIADAVNVRICPAIRASPGLSQSELLLGRA